MKPSAESWKEILQGFLVRLRWNQADFVAQSELTVLRITGNPLYLTKDMVSLYLRKENSRMPHARERHIELVDFFAIHRELKNEGEANLWIGLAGHQLVQQEISTIFGTTFTVIFKTPPSPEIRDQLAKILEKLGATIG
jgi:hypothetical protein